MKDRPEGIAERDIALVLADGWGIAAGSLRYAPVGAGSYHWLVGEEPGERRFVTVDDLDDKGWLGRTRAAVLAGLRAAMDAAVTLRRQAGLGFVVAPVPGAAGETVRPVGDRHAVAVFPFLAGTPGDWGEPLPVPERGELVKMLAALHRTDSAGVRLRRSEPGLSWRGDLETALGELARPWTGGPYAEPARALLAAAAGPVRRQLERLDRWSAGWPASEVVITHGEPHPGNVLRTPGGLMLIDWDTIGLAPPERDLWMVATESGDELRRYTELTGRPVDTTAIELYRRRWALDDVSCFVRDLRAPHRHTPDAEEAWQALETALADLTH